MWTPDLDDSSRKVKRSVDTLGKWVGMGSHTDERSSESRTRGVDGAEVPLFRKGTRRRKGRGKGQGSSHGRRLRRSRLGTSAVVEVDLLQGGRRTWGWGRNLVVSAFVLGRNLLLYKNNDTDVTEKSCHLTGASGRWEWVGVGTSETDPQPLRKEPQ